MYYMQDVTISRIGAGAVCHVRDHELKGGKDEDVNVLEYDRAFATRLTEVPQVAWDERERHKPKPYHLKITSSGKQHRFSISHTDHPHYNDDLGCHLAFADKRIESS
jgi:hypothetical protein